MPSRHILVNSRMVSSHISVVTSRVGMPKPNTSVVDEPRPVPNSKRPSERWSSMATRSAMRAGWLTGGVVLKMAEPTWILEVRAATKERKTSGAGMCEYSVRKWCSGHHTYLTPCFSHSMAKSRIDLSMYIPDTRNEASAVAGGTPRMTQLPLQPRLSMALRMTAGWPTHSKAKSTPPGTMDLMASTESALDASTKWVAPKVRA